MKFQLYLLCLLSFLFFNPSRQAKAQSWSGDRLLDANGVLKVLADIMGPAGANLNYSTANTVNWSITPKLHIQKAYADMGGNCDLLNPHKVIQHEAVDPPVSHSNGIASTVSQNGTFTSCFGNHIFSKNDFSPKALLTRAGWMYRLCRLVATRSTSLQVTMLSQRVKANDPVAGSSLYVEQRLSSLEAGATTTSVPNWCQIISAPTKVEIAKLFRTFYPGRVIPQIQRDVSNSYPIAQQPLYLERLLELVSHSNALLDGETTQNLNTLENPCVPGGSYGDREQIKAVNAWRALFLTMCMDPGWQVL
jgi:hypothetical protein